jgi:hypothetical protein
MASNTPTDDACKEVTTSKDTAVIQSGKPGLSFHPGVMDRGVAVLHNNAPRGKTTPTGVVVVGTDQVGQDFCPENNDHHLHWTIESMPPNEQRGQTRETTSTPMTAYLATHAARGIAAKAHLSWICHSGIHTLPTTEPDDVVHPATPPSRNRRPDIHFSSCRATIWPEMKSSHHKPATLALGALSSTKDAAASPDDPQV